MNGNANQQVDITGYNIRLARANAAAATLANGEQTAEQVDGAATQLTWVPHFEHESSLAWSAKDQTGEVFTVVFANTSSSKLRRAHSSRQTAKLSAEQLQACNSLLADQEVANAKCVVLLCDDALDQIDRQFEEGHKFADGSEVTPFRRNVKRGGIVTTMLTATAQACGFEITQPIAYDSNGEGVFRRVFVADELTPEFGEQFAELLRAAISADDVGLMRPIEARMHEVDLLRDDLYRLVRQFAQQVRAEESQAPSLADSSTDSLRHRAC